MFLGREQIYHPEYSIFEKIYIALFGMPVVGLRIRGRNIFSLIPKDCQYEKILDAGSGPGVLTFELARRYKQAMVTGIDLVGAAINVSSYIAGKIKFENVQFVKSSIEDMKGENIYDLILCVDILEHIENDLKAIENLCSLLSENGTLILHVPALYRRYPIFKKKINFDVPTHIRPGYLIEEIQSKVLQSGFVIQEKGYTYGFFETLANNLSYMITGANKENKLFYAFLFPFLNLLSFIGAGARPKELGAGIYIIATK